MKLIISIFFAFLFVGCGEEKESKEQPTPPKVDVSVPTDTDTTSTEKVGDSSERTFSDYRNGDIIFQNRNTDYAQFLGVATGSQYNHVGLIRANRKGKIKVLEVGDSVHIVPLEEWIAQGIDGKYAVKRLHGSDELFVERNIMTLVGTTKPILGKKQDKYLDWSADEFYSSELVWKILQAGVSVEVCELQKFTDFKIGDQAVIARLKEHFGAIPLEHQGVSPDAIYNSPKVFSVFEK